MKMTGRRSIAASRNGPSEKRAGAPRNGSQWVRERCDENGSVRSPSRPAMPPESSQRRSDSIASRRPSAIVWSCVPGASAASVAFSARALSSYMIIATRMPLPRPSARSASKLPRCAPIISTPSPWASASSIASMPFGRSSNWS